MADFLIFQLAGPLAAWGEVAVGQTRDSALVPTRSALLGLVAAALGVTRGESDRLASLHSGLGVLAATIDPGQTMSDYHTIQTPGPRRKGPIRATRREELAEPKSDLNTILSQRMYRAGGLWLGGLWRRGEGGPDLDGIAQALAEPVFALSLGRRSCPPSHPLSPRIIAADDPVAACRTYKDTSKDDRLWKDKPLKHVEWDIDAPGAADTRRRERRADAPRPGSRQFDLRQVHVGGG